MRILLYHRFSLECQTFEKFFRKKQTREQKFWNDPEGRTVKNFSVQFLLLFETIAD